MRFTHANRLAPIAAVCCLTVACSRTEAKNEGKSRAIPLAQPIALAETAPVVSADDAADDPAIWVHPTDPAQSLVLGTNKQGGLDVYSLDGSRLATVSNGSHPDNVDVAYDIQLGDKRVDVAGAATRGAEHGFQFWIIDARTRTLTPLSEHPIPVLGGKMPYGSTLYRRARDGQLYFFVDDKRGRVEQYQVEGAGGTLRSTLVRSFEVGGQVEGCVADDEYGRFYVCEESRAIWCYGAEPDDPCDAQDRTAVERIGGAHGAVADLEGLTIYYAGGGKGYLLASIQGANRFFVYDREGDHALVKIVDPKASVTLGDVSDSDGIVAESFALAHPFDRGVFIVQDGDNAPRNQNFKLYAWPDVAETDLVVDTKRDPRGPVWRR